MSHSGQDGQLCKLNEQINKSIIRGDGGGKTEQIYLLNIFLRPKVGHLLVFNYIKNPSASLKMLGTNE